MEIGGAITVSSLNYGGWRAAVALDELRGRFEATESESASLNASITGFERRASVEVIAGLGGIMPRAALGGTFIPDAEKSLRLEVGSRGMLPLNQPREFSSALGGRMVHGLAREFARDALDGLVQVATGRARPSGRLVVEAGAYDEVDSGRLAFFRAAELLVTVLWSRPNEVERNIVVTMTGWKDRWRLED